VGQHVGVVLVGVARGQAVDILAKQLGLGVADGVRVARGDECRGQVRRQAEAVVDLAEADGPGVRGDAGTGLAELDGLVERGFEEPFVWFIHWVCLPFRGLTLTICRHLRGGTCLGSRTNRRGGE